MGRMAAAILPVVQSDPRVAYSPPPQRCYGVAQLKPPTTATGDGAGSGFGFPSMLLALLPQHFATPLVVTPQDWMWPRSIVEKTLPPVTATGVNMNQSGSLGSPLAEPVPICPTSFCPQQ